MSDVSRRLCLCLRIPSNGNERSWNSKFTEAECFSFIVLTSLSLAGSVDLAGSPVLITLCVMTVFLVSTPLFARFSADRVLQVPIAVAQDSVSPITNGFN